MEGGVVRESCVCCKLVYYSFPEMVEIEVAESAVVWSQLDLSIYV